MAKVVERRERGPFGRSGEPWNWKALAGGLADMYTLGGIDEIGGLLGTRDYKSDRANMRFMLDELRRESPDSYSTGQLIGGALNPLSKLPVWLAPGAMAALAATRNSGYERSQALMDSEIGTLLKKIRRLLPEQ